MTIYEKYRVVWEWMNKDDRWIGNMPVGFKVPHWFDFNNSNPSSGLLGSNLICKGIFETVTPTNKEILWINLVYHEIIKLDDNKR